MKNSLFKRAFAVAAAAPLALTQCLTVANAASINNADIAAVANETVTADQSITLKGEGGLSYITPGKEADGKDYYMVGDAALASLGELTEDSYEITKDSTWNETVLGKIQSEAGKSGSFSIQSALEEAAKRAGNYQDITNKIIKHVGDVNYSIADNGDITLTAAVSDIVPEFTEGSKKTIGDVLNDLSAKYGVEITTDDTFSDVTVAGTFTAVIKASSLDDTKIEGTLEFKSDKGKTYKGTEIADYGLAQLDALQKDANAAIDKAFDATKSEEIADCKAQVADSLGYYKKQLNRVKTWSAKAQTKTTELKKYGTFDEALQAAKASRFGQRAESRFNKEIPTSASEIVSKELVSTIYDKIVNQIEKNSKFTVDITTEDLGAFADGLFDISTQLLGGSATFSAKFTDFEADDVKAYILEEYGLDVTEVYKTIDITADYSAIDKGEAAVDVKVKRVIEAVTTTTTETTTSTTTETTETTETTTESTETTTESTETTTESTETTTESTETTTESTETTTESTETTTVSTDEGIDTSTTTSKEVKTVANYYVTSKTGFYLNIDEEFNKEQIESVYVSIDETEYSYGEDGTIVAEKVLAKGKGYNVTDKVGFGSQTPANVFVKGDYKFSHEIALYATEDIVVDENVITKAGEVLKSGDDTEAITIAYVGVKGDGDLNYMADAKDASLVLVWYAKMSTMDDPEARANEVFSNSDQITDFDENGERVIRENYDKTLDQFAAFLCDVDNENADDNWYALKKTRKIDAKDTSFILVMYSATSTGTEPNRQSWNETLKDFAKKAVSTEEEA